MLHPPPDYALGAGEALQHERRTTSIRVAPARDALPIASFWRFWAQGDEVYVAWRDLIGVHKLSLHSSGRWVTTMDSLQGKLAAPFPLSGERWLHALEVRFLVGEGALPPRAQKAFKRNRPGYLIGLREGDLLALQLLFGASGTTHATPLPPEMNWPKLLEISLRDGTCVVLVAATFPMNEHHRADLRNLRAVRLRTSAPITAREANLELFRLAVDRRNIITVVPLGPESFSTREQSPR